MSLFSLEHSKVAYRIDFALYDIAVTTLGVYLLIAGPGGRRLEIMGFTLTGLLGWTAVEYVLHRFVLHRMKPFHRWHLEHHQRPAALICTPTILSSALIAILVFIPMLLLADFWRACGLTLGLLIGYLGYAITHHAIHHWHSNSAWLEERKRCHTLHHIGEPGYYGVTTRFWDRILSA